MTQQQIVDTGLLAGNNQDYKIVQITGDRATIEDNNGTQATVQLINSDATISSQEQFDYIVLQIPESSSYIAFNANQIQQQTPPTNQGPDENTNQPSTPIDLGSLQMTQEQVQDAINNEGKITLTDKHTNQTDDFTTEAPEDTNEQQYTKVTQDNQNITLYKIQNAKLNNE